MSSCFEITVHTGSTRAADRKLRNAISKAARPYGLRVTNSRTARVVAQAIAAVPGVDSVLVEKVTRTHVDVYRVPMRERSKASLKVKPYRTM